jgi:tetratricopeptide (TPR) repeat protein
MAQQKASEEKDEFLEALQRGYRYTLENFKFISLIVGGVLAGVVIIVFVLYQIKLNKIKDAALMNRAVAAYQDGNAEEALTSLEEVSGKEGVAGVMASLYQGNILYEGAKFEEALQHFEKALELSQGSELSTLRGLALQGAAYSSIALKDFDKAEETFLRVDDPFKDLALLELGRLYTAKGEHEEASRLLDELISNFPDSPWVAKAEVLKEQVSR